MRRLIIPAVVALILLTAIGFYFFERGRSEITYNFAPVERGPIASVVSAAGTVELSTSVPVVARTQGEVLEVVANHNAAVKAGDILARISPDAALARLEVARADLNVARGAAEIAASQIELARQQVENARASLESARVTVKAAQLGVSDAERDLGITRKLAATGDAARMETERAKSVRGRADNELAAAMARGKARPWRPTTRRRRSCRCLKPSSGMRGRRLPPARSRFVKPRKMSIIRPSAPQ